MNKDLLGGGVSKPLTLTLHNDSNLGSVTIGNQLIWSFDARDKEPMVINYSDISDLSGEIVVSLDGFQYNEGYHKAENINITYHEMDLGIGLTEIKGYIIDPSKSSYLGF